MSLGALSTTASMPHNGTRWLVQPSIRLEMLRYGFHLVLFYPHGTMAACQMPIPRTVLIHLSSSRQSKTSLPSTRSRTSTRRCSNRFNRRIAMQARLRRSEKVSQILKKLNAYDKHALGSIPAAPKHQAKTTAAYLHHTNDHLYPANFVPPSPRTHLTEQHSLAQAPIRLRATIEHRTILSKSGIAYD